MSGALPIIMHAFKWSSTAHRYFIPAMVSALSSILAVSLQAKHLAVLQLPSFKLTWIDFPKLEANVPECHDTLDLYQEFIWRVPYLILIIYLSTFTMLLMSLRVHRTWSSHCQLIPSFVCGENQVNSYHYSDPGIVSLLAALLPHSSFPSQRPCIALTTGRPPTTAKSL